MEGIVGNLVDFAEGKQVETFESFKEALEAAWAAVQEYVDEVDGCAVDEKEFRDSFNKGSGWLNCVTSLHTAKLVMYGPL